MSQPTKKLGKLLNSAQIREMLQISEPQFYDWIRAGKLPYYRLGRKYMFDQSEIEQMIIDSRPVETEKEPQTA